MVTPDEPPLQPNLPLNPLLTEETLSSKEVGKSYAPYPYPIVSTPESTATSEFSVSRTESIEELVTRQINDHIKILKSYYSAQLQAKDLEVQKCKEEIAYLRKTIESQVGKPIYIEAKAMAGAQFNSDTFTTDLRGANISNFANKIRDNAHQQTNQYNYSIEQKQSLEEAATEIQELLELLSKTYPTTTYAEQITVAAKAIEQIENNSSLMDRILSALRAGGVEAFEQFLNHPASSFVIAALKDWQDTGKNWGGAS
jgi:hypothetical protein